MNHVPAPDIPADLMWLDPPSSGARSLLDLRGRPVLLHFWTRSCVNCRQVMAELDRVVDPFGAAVAVIGVHVPKFAAEREDEVVRAGMKQLGVDHPVINDADYRLCRLFGLRHWPTVVVVDAEGDLVFEAVGETAVAGLGPLLANLVASAATPTSSDIKAEPIPDHVPRRGSARQRNGEVANGTLPSILSPHRLLALVDGWLVAEQRGDVVRLGQDFKPLRRYKGFDDPAGMCLLPDGRVAVADTGAHRVIGIDLDHDNRRVLVGDGSRAARRVRPGLAARDTALASPHDVAWWQGQLVVAVTGLHQLIGVPDADPGAPVVLIAGSSAEGFKDGSARRARLAMPMALAADTDRLWFTDADSSSLRFVEGGRVGSVLGHGVSVSGHCDGPAAGAQLQHPCGISLDAIGRVLIADVFNGAVRRYDPTTNEVMTVVAGLFEPTDVITGDRPDEVIVVERAGHRLQSMALAPQRTSGARQLFVVPPTLVARELEIRFAGGGGATMEVAAEPTDLVKEVVVTATGARVRFTSQDENRTGRLEVVITRDSCDEWCSIDRLSWSIPVYVDAENGASSLPLLPR